VKMASDT